MQTSPLKYTPIGNYLIRFLFLYAAFYIQSLFLNPILVGIGSVDLVSLIVFFVCFEKKEIFAAIHSEENALDAIPPYDVLVQHALRAL